MPLSLFDYPPQVRGHWGINHKVKGGKKMISERTLRKWRRDALEFKENTADIIEARPILEVCDRVLKLTQELLDQHLLRRIKK